MANGPSKTSGKADSAIGAIKENVGSALGNHSLEAKGAAQRTKGDAEVQSAKAQGYAEGTKNSVKGSAKDTVGSMIGNEQMQMEGKASKMQGDAQKGFNS